MAKSITFIVTKDCQLACKYCYLVGKNEKERMPWEVAKAAIDYILDHEHDDVFNTESVIFDFIGGEPFLEIELIDRICDYLKVQMFSLGHHWFNSYRFSFSTNGINYDSEAVQRFIRKNLDHLSIGITIDGTRRKHDLNRVWKHRDGEPERGRMMTWCATSRCGSTNFLMEEQKSQLAVPTFHTSARACCTFIRWA